MAYTAQEIRSAASRAAEQTVKQIDSFPDGLVTHDDLLRMAGLVAPLGESGDGLLTKEEYELWGFQVMALREAWRCDVHERLGRWPRTERGIGFRILRPDQNVDYAESTVLRKVVKTIEKGLFIIRATRDNDLGENDRLKKTRASMRFGALAGSAKHAEREAHREHRLRNEPNPERPMMPGPMNTGIENQ